ncbi:MAG: carbon-nitrogen hydrolase family protein [Sphingobium sp.]
MTQADKITLAVVNFHALWGEKAANLARIKDRITEAHDKGANLILFPETALTGYNVDGDSVAMHRDNAETIPGPASNELEAMARDLGVYIIVGMPERDETSGKVYNSALVVGPSGMIGRYRKIHLPGKEAMWAARGNDAFIFDTPWGPMGLGICYDTYFFPEICRAYAAMGARLYLNPTAVPIFPHWRDLYYTTLKARVLENACYIASANLVGDDKDCGFGGGSLVVGPGEGPINATYYADAIEDREALIITTIDLSRVDAVRQMLPIYTDNPLTGTPDWRPEIYERLLAQVRQHDRWRAVEAEKMAAE